MEEINNLNQFHIILGDFNINFIGKKSRMLELLFNYHHIVTEPTHISGSLIDHDYLSKSFFVNSNVKSAVITVNCTNCDAVRFCLLRKVNGWFFLS